LQIAAYDSAHHTSPVATTIQSTVVGGEPGGRPEYILKGDAVNNVPEAKKEGDHDTTSLLANVPQPGHDVFAEQPVKDINSQNRPPPPPEPKVEEEKEVSKVVATPDPHATQPPPEEKAKDGGEEAKEEKADPAVHGEDKPPVAEQKDEEKVTAPAQGPLQHDDAEAEMAREDLFPDAA
jgi:hypothetical protein